MIVVFLFLVAFASATAQISTPTQFVPQPFDVEHYNATLLFPDPAARTIVGDVSIHVRWTASADRLEFPFHLRGLQIDSVFVNEQPASFTTVGSASSDTMHHRVVISHSVAGNRRDTIRVFYHGTMQNEGGSSPWGGVHYQDSVLYCLGVGFTANYVSTTQHWLACYDHPSDKATFRARFIVPEGPWNVASVGKRIFTRPPWPNGYMYFDWQEDNPIATYLLTFAIAPYVTIDMDGPVPHTFYTLRRDSAKSATSFSRVPRMTTLFEQRFAPYPFYKVGYCNTEKGAMEHQTMISFPVSIAQQADTSNVTAAHELAHQWFGDFVSPLDFRYAWLTESFATFAESLWLEHLRGWSTYLLSIQTKARSYINQISRSEGVFALEDFPRNNPSSNYPQTIYQKGAVVVAMARAIAGDTAFFAALRQYLTTNAYGTASTEHMKTSLRGALGGSTDAFFQEWVTGKGWAQLRVEIEQTSGGSSVVVRQVQKAAHPDWPVFTTMPLSVRYTVQSSSGTDTVDTVLFPDAQGTYTFTCTQLIGVNIGSRCRSLAEVLQTVYVVDANSNTQSSSAGTYTLAPNPSGSRVQLLRSYTDQMLMVQVLDSRGAVVTQQRCDVGAATCTINTTTLADGTYSVIIEANGRTTRLPLVVTRGE